MYERIAKLLPLRIKFTLCYLILSGRSSFHVVIWPSFKLPGINFVEKKYLVALGSKFRYDFLDNIKKLI
jgi:hypothetical protein